MTDGKPTRSPFMSITQRDPAKPSAPLRILILSDLQAIPQRVAQLSEWLADNGFAFTIDVILVIGVSRPHKRTDIRHIDLAELGNDSTTLGELEHICPRVVYVPGMHEAGASWEAHNPPSLTPTSLNAIKGPVHIASDLVVVHRRFADGLTEKPVQQLPLSWKKTLYSKLSPPLRYRIPQTKSAIVLCSSQLPNQGSSSKSLAFLRTVRSLLSLNRNSIPPLDYIMAVVPPKMQRVPTSSNVFKTVERTLDPGTFVEGDFWIADLRRLSVWDPEAEPEVDEDQLMCESAWEVAKTAKYNMERPASKKEQDP